LAFSTGWLLELPDFDELEEVAEFEFSVCLPVSLSVRLQSESENAIRSRRGISFIVRVLRFPDRNLIEL
jgi:hypothetical protein